MQTYQVKVSSKESIIIPAKAILDCNFNDIQLFIICYSFCKTMYNEDWIRIYTGKRLTNPKPKTMTIHHFHAGEYVKLIPCPEEKKLIIQLAECSVIARN